MNLYTQFEILSFDRIAFAHSLSANNYRYTLQSQGYGIYGETPEDGAVLEIGFVEQNPIILKNEDTEVLVDENCIFIIPPQSVFTVDCLNEGLHRHTTVEFLIRGSAKPAEEFSPPSGKSVTLPLIIPPSAGSGEIFSLIRNITCSHTTNLKRNYFQECADFMLLIHKLCALVRSTNFGNVISPGNRRYCDRAKAYISENIDRKISVGEIAAAVGISKNYLTNIFSGSEGLPLMEYVNRRKLSYMIELIRRYGYSLAQAGEHVGFADANYVSRIFKRYYGMTLTEYKQTKLQGAEDGLSSSDEDLLF